MKETKFSEMKFVEKRKYVRLDVHAKVNVKVEDNQHPDASTTSTFTKNLSMKGVCFVYDKNIEPGTILKLEIIIPEQNLHFNFVGQVRWSKPLTQETLLEGAKQMFEVGVKFYIIDKNDMTKFADYIVDKAFEDAKKKIAE